MRILSWVLIGGISAFLPCLCVAGSLDISQTSDPIENSSSCLGWVSVYDTVSTVRIGPIPDSLENENSPTNDQPMFVGGGLDLSNHTVSASGVTFNSVNISGTGIGSGVVLANNTGGNVNFTNLSVSSGGVTNSSPQDSGDSTTGRTLDLTRPTAFYDPSSGKMSFTHLRNASSSPDRSIAIFLESALPVFQYCTTDRADANIFIPGNRRNPIFAAADQDFLLWYYDDAASLPETVPLGNVVEPGTPSEALIFLYWTSDLEFNFPFDRNNVFSGPIVVVPEPHSLILSTFALLAIVLTHSCHYRLLRLL